MPFAVMKIQIHLMYHLQNLLYVEKMRLVLQISFIQR